MSLVRSQAASCRSAPVPSRMMRSICAISRCVRVHLPRSPQIQATRLANFALLLPLPCRSRSVSVDAVARCHRFSSKDDGGKSGTSCFARAIQNLAMIAWINAALPVCRPLVFGHRTRLSVSKNGCSRMSHQIFRVVDAAGLDRQFAVIFMLGLERIWNAGARKTFNTFRR